MREAALKGFLLVAVTVVFATELLSAFGALSAGPVRALWIALAAGAGIAVWRLRRSARGSAASGGAFERILWLAGAAVLAPALVVAAVWPVINFDSLVYHIPRIETWIQQGSVAHFTTGVPRQLYQPPLLEYLMLHARLLGGGESVYCLVPIGILALTGLAASALAERLSGLRAAGVLAFVLVVSHPTAVLQASNPKNDILVGLWMLCALLWLVEAHRTRTALPIGLAALTVSLAVLAKGTALLFTPALALAGVWLVWNQRSAHSSHSRWLLAAMVMVAFLLPLPHFSRNVSTFGSPLGPGPEAGGDGYANERFGFPEAVSNLVRNTALHLHSPWTGFNRTLQSAVDGAHGPLGIAADDPATTWPGTRPDFSQPLLVTEDTSPAPLALGLSLAAVGWMLLRRDARTFPRVAAACCMVAGALLFVALLKWQPWHSRLHVPLLLVGVALAASFLRTRPVAAALATVSVVIGFWVQVKTVPRGLATIPQMARLERSERLSSVLPDYCAELDAVMSLAVARKPGEIILVGGSNDWHYPLWRWIASNRPDLKVRQAGDVLSPARETDSVVLVLPGGRARMEQGPFAAIPRLHKGTYFELLRLQGKDGSR